MLEDNLPQAESLGDVLHVLGHQPYLAGDGVQAQAQVEMHGCEAALIDWVTPSMDSGVFLHWLRSRPETARVPVVIGTGLSAQKLEEARALPRVRILYKPFDVEELLLALDEIARAEDQP